MKLWTALVTFLCASVSVHAQESVAALQGAGPATKYLTPGQLDTWIFEAEKGETLIAHVETKEFDSILELAAKGEKEDKVLFEVDDEGSDGRFAVRLPEKGEYRIRVHAYKYKGGGNYHLHVQRFQAVPLPVGKAVLGTFDRAGKSHYYFPGVKDQILIPDWKGTAANSWVMLDSKGRGMPNWSGTVRVEESGEHYFVLTGHPNHRYDLLMREAGRRDLGEGQANKGRLQQGEMEVWSFIGKPGDFRLLEVEKKGELASRVLSAPLQKQKTQQLAHGGELPEIQLLPVASRGSHLRFAVLLGREGRYQLQMLAQTPASYTLRLGDPSVPINRDQEVKGVLPVGGSAFHSFEAQSGQLVQATLGSQEFVPFLRLYDSRGNLVEKNDDAADQESRITYMVQQAGLFRMQVSSVGDGGGGDFRLALQDKKLKELELGGRSQATLQPNTTDFWAFSGQEGKTVILSVRSSAFLPMPSMHSPDGVQLSGDLNREPGANSLMAVKLPKTGRYTIWISTRRGAGDYTLRLIDGD